MRLRMVRWNLDKIPHFPLPNGFSFKWFEPGDEELWLQIQLLADRTSSLTPASFDEQFGSNIEALRQRQCYLVSQDLHTVGTATAWFNDDFLGKKFGRVHWVALDPEYQGRGLSRPLLSAICDRLHFLGHVHAYLSTAPERIPAIRTYLRFGFEPLIENESDAELWQRLDTTLKDR